MFIIVLGLGLLLKGPGLAVQTGSANTIGQASSSSNQIADTETGPVKPMTAARSTCGEDGCILPQSSLFDPLIADPKQPRFFASTYRYNSGVDRFVMGAVGYGEDFGLMRWGNPQEGSYQIGFLGGLFGQFNLDAPSNDLINADYTIGIPVEYRRGSFSVRSRIYHQSSHLGDEFLLRADTDRINLSFESFELLASYELSNWRLYGGGEYLLHRIPESLDRASVHAGAEYIAGEEIGDVGSLIGGVDYKSFAEHNWSPDYSAKIGIEFHRPDHIKRHIRFMLEAYQGHSPFGQFYKDRISFYGVGIQLGL
ncbi:MAG: DUF1207 domain-containing protein [bacterium]